MSTIRVVHYLNQFFSGIGAEEYAGIGEEHGCKGIPFLHAGSLAEGAALARSVTNRGSIVLSVKCWR